MNLSTPQSILEFWFDELSSEQWWKKDAALDQEIRNRFSETHTSASRCELFEWRKSAQGRLAEILVLDQFSRNMFRDTPKAFASDTLALALSQEAISRGAERELNQIERNFLYMPFMHSESPKIHEEAVRLFEANGLSSNLDFELRHKAIIDRFGRYPHRNEILGRQSTPEEEEFLKEKGSRF